MTPTMKRSCWDCTAFRTDLDKFHETGGWYYYCNNGHVKFPKPCEHYEYEPGSDYAVRQQEKTS